MNLKIINNINIENKRKHKKINISKEEDITNDEEQNDSFSLESYDVRSYYSLYYGELTKNWITLKPKKSL